MTQKAATMAMKISVVWTMGSGMPIVVRPIGWSPRQAWLRARRRSGGRRAGAALRQRCAAMPGDALATVTARGRHAKAKAVRWLVSYMPLGAIS